MPLLKNAFFWTETYPKPDSCISEAGQFDIQRRTVGVKNLLKSMIYEN